MPSLEDLPTLDELPVGSLATDDLVPVWDVSSRTIKKVRIDTFATDEEAATPASVEVQIGGYPVSILENPQSLARLHDTIQALDQLANGTTVALVGFGDSRASLTYEFGYVFDDLVKTHGLGGICTPGLGNSYNGQPAWVLAGGATKAATTYDYDPGSNLLTIPVGGSAEWVWPGTTGSVVLRPSSRIAEGKNNPQTNNLAQFMPMGIAKVVVYAIKESGGGTLTATLEQSGYSDVTDTLDTDAADGCGTITLTPNNRAGAMTLSLTSTDATCKVFGAIFYTDRGLVWINSQVGGSTMTQQLPSLSGGEFKPAYSEFLAAVNTAGIFHSQRVPGDAGWQANYGTFFAAYEALGYSQIVLGETPRSEEQDPTTTEINDYLRSECASRGIGFFDPKKLATIEQVEELGWNTGDDAHGLQDYNRYVASRLLDAIGRFRTAFGAFDTGGFSRNNLASERFRLLGLHAMRSTTIFGRAGITVDGAASSVYAAPTVTNERGFNFSSTAALGHTAGRIGILLAGRNTISTNTYNITISGNGYRNLNIKAGLRAFILFGGSSTTVTTLTGLSQKCFGLEFALGSDVGSPDGYTSEVVRMFSYDGATRIDSHWVPCVLAGQSAASTGGFGFVWHYDLELKTHFFFSAQNLTNSLTGPYLRMSLYDPAIHTAATTAGVWCHMGLFADDGGNIPAAAGGFSFLNITSIWDSNLPTHPIG